MQPINLNCMLEDQNKEYFEDAYWVTEKMGLHPLMRISEKYNIEFVHQFFATVVFGSTPDIPMTWMSGDDLCRSNFVEPGVLVIALNITRIILSYLVPQCSAYRTLIQILVLLAVEDAVINARMYLLHIQS